METRIEIAGELLKLCEQFIKDKKISCAETIYQADRVMEDAENFIENICDIVGYHKEN